MDFSLCTTLKIVTDKALQCILKSLAVSLIILKRALPLNQGEKVCRS